MNTVKLSTAQRGMRGLGVAVLLAASMGRASAGLFDDDEARKAILDLRTKVANTEQRLAEETRRASEDSAQMQRSLIDLQNQLEALRSDMAKLRGQDEEMARQLADMQRQQKDAVQTVNDRLQKFEPSRVTVDGREFVADPVEKRDYDAAMASFRRGEFGPVQVTFVEFLNRYPNTGFRPTALFWLGNAQYATKDYKAALSSFRALVALGADNMRVPEALLASANCQLELKDNKGARKTMDDLIANYPTSEAAQAAKDRLARLK